jgi:hypothetical protein
MQHKSQWKTSFNAKQIARITGIPRKTKEYRMFIQTFIRRHPVSIIKALCDRSIANRIINTYSKFRLVYADGMGK